MCMLVSLPARVWKSAAIAATILPGGWMYVAGADPYWKRLLRINNTGNEWGMSTRNCLAFCRASVMPNLSIRARPLKAWRYPAPGPFEFPLRAAGSVRNGKIGALARRPREGCGPAVPGFPAAPGRRDCVPDSTDRHATPSGPGPANACPPSTPRPGGRANAGSADRLAQNRPAPPTRQAVQDGSQLRRCPKRNKILPEPRFAAPAPKGPQVWSNAG